MTKRRRTQSAARNLVRLCLLFAATGGIVILVHYFERDIVLLYDVAEERSYEYRHDHERNAFFAIQAARDLLVKKPEPLMVPAPDAPDRQQPINLRPSALGSLIEVQRPEDDAQFIDYLETFVPLRPLVREAAARPYYLHPKPLSKWSDYPKKIAAQTRRIGYGLVGLADLYVRRPADWDEVAACLAEVNALARMLENEGRLMGEASLLHDRLLREAQRIARMDVPSPLLARLQRMLETEPRPFTDRRRMLELVWRMRYDNHHRFPEILRERLGNETDRSFRKRVRDRFRLWRNQHAAQVITTRWGEIYAILPKHPIEVREWSDMFFENEWTGGERRYPFSDVVWVAAVSAFQNAFRDATVLTMAVERYQRDQRAYPSDLESLAPDYIESVPTDPINGGPFHYERLDGGYLIVSNGDNGQYEGSTNDDIILAQYEGAPNADARPPENTGS